MVLKTTSPRVKDEAADFLALLKAVIKDLVSL